MWHWLCCIMKGTALIELATVCGYPPFMLKYRTSLWMRQHWLALAGIAGMATVIHLTTGAGGDRPQGLGFAELVLAGITTAAGAALLGVLQLSIDTHFDSDLSARREAVEELRKGRSAALKLQLDCGDRGACSWRPRRRVPSKHERACLQ